MLMLRKEFTLRSERQTCVPVTSGELLKGLLKSGLVGQPFLFARFTYGDELTLHFGESGFHTYPKTKDIPVGSHCLGVRASNWSVTTPSRGNYYSWDPPRGVKPRDLAVTITSAVGPGSLVLLALPLMTVESMPAPNLAWAACALRLYVGDAELTVYPAKSSDPEVGPPEFPLDDWDLLSPKAFMSVGPGMTGRVEDHG